MAITATITNFAKQGDGFIMFVQYSDGDAGTFGFSSTDDKNTVIDAVKQVLAHKNSIEAKVDQLKALYVGKVITE